MNQCLYKNAANVNYFEKCKSIRENGNANHVRNDKSQTIIEENERVEKKDQVVFTINQLEKPTIDAVLNQVPLVYNPITKQLLLQSSSKSSQTSDYKSNDEKTLDDLLSSKDTSLDDDSILQVSSSDNDFHDSSQSDSLELLDSREDLLQNQNSFDKKKVKDESNLEPLSLSSFSSSSSSSNTISRRLSLLTTSLSLTSTLQNVVNRWKKKKQNGQMVVASTTALILENRPSNLPAKDAQEEERHRSEYEEMVKQAKKKEIKSIKSSKKVAEKKLKKEGQIIECSKVWQKDILSDWDQMKCSKKAKELWWQGLPSSVRQKVWKLVIGNDLNIDDKKFNLYVENINLHHECCEMIKLDVSRTLPQLGLFQEDNGPYHSTLLTLLLAYNCMISLSPALSPSSSSSSSPVFSKKTSEDDENSSNAQTFPLGYCQGMSFLAAMLLLNMSTPIDAFIAFSNLIHKTQLLKAFFQVDQKMMNAYYSTYSLFFQSNIPLLFEHFEKQKLTPDLYLVDWIYALFSKSLPLDISTRIWDLFFRDEDEFIFRCSIGILKMYFRTLIEMDFISLAQFLTKLPEDIDEEKLFSVTSKIKMTLEEKKYKRTFRCVLNTFLECSD